jgi:DNA-binding beta-propeller fold protein YncE
VWGTTWMAGVDICICACDVCVILGTVIPPITVQVKIVPLDNVERPALAAGPNPWLDASAAGSSDPADIVGYLRQTCAVALATDTNGDALMLLLDSKYGGRVAVQRKRDNNITRFVGDGILQMPTAIANLPGRPCRVAVCDAALHAVFVFALDTGAMLARMGSFGMGPGQLNLPSSVAVSPHGHLVVASCRSHRLVVFTMTGEHVATLGHDRGQMPCTFSYPKAVAMLSDGRWVVAELGGQEYPSRVQLLGPIGTDVAACLAAPSDIPVQVIGEYRPQSPTPLVHPSALALSASLGAGFLAPVIKQPSLDQVLYPCDVAVSRDTGEIVVADTGNHRLVVFNAVGQYLRSLGADDEGRGRLEQPVSLAVHSSMGIVYVSDGLSQRMHSLPLQ